MIDCRKKEADLHNHTTCSDGEYSPGDLVRLAAEIGLKAIGVTDHDTIEGLDEAMAAGREAGIDVVCGSEVTLRFVEPFFRGSLHLLIYFPDRLTADEAFRRDTQAALEAGRGPSLTRDRIAAINAEFGPSGSTPALPRDLFEEDIYKHGHRISRRHFAKALNDLGIVDQDRVSAIIGNDSPAYIPSGMPMEIVKSYFRKWPVIRVMAHPAAGSFPGENHYREVLPPFETVERLLPRFLDLGLDGLESCYPGHTPELMERLEAIRVLHGLPLATGGSDCHDAVSRPLGVAGVPYETVIRMRELMTERFGG